MGIDRGDVGARRAIGSAWLGVAMAALVVPAMAQEPKDDRPQRQGEAGARPRVVPQSTDRPGAGDEPGGRPAGGLRLPRAETPEGLAEGPEGDPLNSPEAAAEAIPADAIAPAPDSARPRATAGPVVPRWPFYYELTFASFDGAAIAGRYYPSQLGPAAAVLVLVHEVNPGRSIRDFDDPIAELDDAGLAGALQDAGYAVMAIDLRGHGRTVAGAGGTDGMTRAIGDLQAAYRFLLDRHNRRELNLSKLGVVGLGNGANLAVAWASTPGGASAIEGRASDLAGLALISPAEALSGRDLAPMAAAVAPRFPMLLEAGAGDTDSAEVVRALQPVVERHRLSRVALVDARLGGTNLLRFAPEATDPLLDFLDNAIKVRTDEWEPRYNLDPVIFANVRVVNRGEAPAPPDAPAPAEDAADAPVAPADDAGDDGT